MAVSDAGVYRFGPAKFLILTILPQGTGPVHALLRKPLDIGCGTHTSLGLKSLDYHILKKGPGSPDQSNREDAYHYPDMRGNHM